MPSSGQLSGYEEREPISPAIPEEGVYEVEYKNKRTNVVRLLPNGFQERKLRKLADASARLFNEVNYERRQQFFQQHQVDFKSTWDKYYEKYKGIVLMYKQYFRRTTRLGRRSFHSSI